MDHTVTFGGKPVTLVGNRCKVGETAPVFTVTDAGLQPVSSDVFHGKVRIYSVFPSVDTPVCSLQNIRFNREASKLGDDVVVVSLSVDLPFAQKRFCAAEGIDRVHVFSDYRELDFGMKYGFVIDSLRLLARRHPELRRNPLCGAYETLRAILRRENPGRQPAHGGVLGHG